MALKKFVANTDAIASEVNNNFSESLTVSGLNHIRTLIDRAGVYSKELIDLWGEAYIDANGRNDSVNTGTSTAVFNIDKYNTLITTTTVTGTTYDPDGIGNPSYFFDNNDETNASRGTMGTTYTSNLGLTFASKYIARIKLKLETVCTASNTNIWLYTYNGSTWALEATLLSVSNVGGLYNSNYDLNKSTQGIMIRITTTSASTRTMNHYFWTMQYGESNTTSTIVHTIPTGTFSSTISKAIGVPMIVDWETGADIKYKLTNATEDSGWLNCGITPEISTFTAFTSEPTSLIVQLVPKSSTPLAAYPSIKGFVVRATS